MKNIKKVWGGLLALAVACSISATTEIPAYAAGKNADVETADESREERELSLYCYESSGQETYEYLTSDFAKKAKTVKDFYSCSVYDQDYDYAQSTISYKVVKNDKYLSFKKNTLTIKKGITAGTHKIKIKVTATKKGYKSSSATKIITVKVRKPRTSGTATGIVATDIGNEMSIPVDVTGTYQVAISGEGAKKFNVYRASADSMTEKLITNGAKVKLNPNKNCFYVVAKDYNPEVWENYEITIKLKKVSN